MKCDPQKHDRRSIRLKGFDYSSAGTYFVTIVTWQREMLFGEIVNGEMILNNLGEIVSEKWQWLGIQYEYVELGTWIVMPNHFHGVLIIHEHGRGDSHSASISRRIAHYADQTQTFGRIDRRVQNGFDKTYQFIA
jgi:REP element-mobilizing transposase RayT